MYGRRSLFEKIGKLCGEVLKTHFEGNRVSRRIGGLVYVLTKNDDWILDVVEAQVGNRYSD